jgi:hypothetical protein
MPQRGRDTYYLELFMAATSSSLVLLCLVHAGRFTTIRFIQESSIRVPLWFWGVLWLTSAVLMASGVLMHHRAMAKWGSLSTASLWFVVLYIGLFASKFGLTMLTAIAPWFVVFNGLIYWYQVRVEGAHYGRLSTG